METIEGNRLIAEFMGASLSLVQNHEHYKYNSGHAFFVHQLSYHDDWSWLMPVVEKIEGKETDLGITVTIQEDICMIDRYLNSPYEKLISKYGGKTKIESTWLAIVEFIQWFNTTKPQC